MNRHILCLAFIDGIFKRDDEPRFRVWDFFRKKVGKILVFDELLC